MCESSMWNRQDAVFSRSAVDNNRVPLEGIQTVEAELDLEVALRCVGGQVEPVSLHDHIAGLQYLGRNA